MRMHYSRRTRSLRPSALATLLLSASLLGGCASGLFSPFRVDLPQGNYLTREQVDRVRPGMTKDQVRITLGTPLLGQIFKENRWDYVFSYRNRQGTTEQRKVSVHFDGDLVSSVESDPLPEVEDASDSALPGVAPARSRALKRQL